jgi:hypothetical protein
VIITHFRRLRDTEAHQLELTWEQFCNEFEKDPPAFQGEDHAGWAPVQFDPPTRVDAHAQSICMLVLDFDKGDSIEAITAAWGQYQGILHSTRSYTPECPRFRASFQLSRPVLPDEFPILWRWAEKKCLEAKLTIDQSAKNIGRFWYQPGKGKHAYIARRIQGDPINPDIVIPAHRAIQHGEQLKRDQQAPISVAMSEREKRARQYARKLPGAISGQGGHRTAWSAVLHVVRGFDLDEATGLRVLEDEYNHRCEPPWSERELTHKVRDAISDARTPAGFHLEERKPGNAPVPVMIMDHQGVPQPTRCPPDGFQWFSAPGAGCVVSQKGALMKLYHNVYMHLRNHQDWAWRWSRNEMTLQPLLDGVELSDTKASEIRRWFERKVGLAVTVEDVRQAIAEVSAAWPVHPVRDYLLGLQWDGVPRLREVSRDFIGADDPLSAELVHRWFIGAAARALRPGCQLDTALMLVGPQGWRKSSFFRVLFGQWFSDSYMDVTSKDCYQQLKAAWCHEWSELETVMHASRESRVKAFLTSPHDNFRAPYARDPACHPRSCVIVGTTNHERFLTDPTGSRRFWVLSVTKKIPVDDLAKVRDQLWAEAVVDYTRGEQWWLREDQDEARETASVTHAVEDTWQDAIEGYVSKPGLREVALRDVLEQAVKLPLERHDHGSLRRAGRILRGLGWTSKTVRHNYGVERRWVCNANGERNAS